MLKIFNTLTRKKETFRPIEPNKVGLYVCGMTVYDYCHIGHARVMIVFDVVARYFRHSGYQVTYVRNITDIDDKIIQRADENKEPIDELTSRYIQAMHEDEDALGNDSPDREPRATRSMEAIIRMIQQLMDNGLAYQGANGDVFYAVSKFKNYGQLSGKNIGELQLGERVEIDQAKQDPLDFVLWKTAKPDEPAWHSPWGKGRPGWHIECSAMSTHCLGDHFDIHGGGMDLQFPHHENEIAQSQGASGQAFVNTWMHNGFVRVDEEKMSKSLGNFFTVREVMKQYRPETIRLFILSSHYRSPLNYSDEQLTEAESALTRLYTALRGLPAQKPTDDDTEFQHRFNTAMDDDFNTPIALSVLFELAREINRIKSEDSQTAADLAALLTSQGKVLGLLQKDPEDYFREGSQAVNNNPLSDEEINQLIEARNIARQNKDWAIADKVRNELNEANIVLEDIASGTEWRRT